jgi:hypothetical protein
MADVGQVFPDVHCKLVHVLVEHLEIGKSRATVLVRIGETYQGQKWGMCVIH